MSQTIWRVARIGSRLALFILLWMIAFPAAARAASIRFVTESDTPFERRLAAEIASVGFEVERPESAKSPLPDTTAAVVYVRNDPPQVELWLLGQAGDFELSSVVRDDAASAGEDAETATLRIAERLRALLQPVYVQARAAEAAAATEAPAPTPAPPSTSAPSSEPEPLVSSTPPPRDRVERARDLFARRFTAAMGLGLGQHTSDVIPQASFAFDYAPTESLAVGALAVLPLRKAVVKSGADRAEIDAWMGGVHGYARIAPLRAVELQLGGGVLGAYVQARGDAQSPRFGRTVSGLRWVPFLEAGVVYGLSPAWQLRAAGLVGVGLPDTPIEFAGERVAEWGRPWVLTQLSLGYAW
ncbi:MAG: hypothetical protein KC766_37510 [Myxococcales bacterium]|nr:hypothetical protein [Myxococcales bacterium]